MHYIWDSEVIRYKSDFLTVNNFIVKVYKKAVMTLFYKLATHNVSVLVG